MSSIEGCILSDQRSVRIEDGRRLSRSNMFVEGVFRGFNYRLTFSYFPKDGNRRPVNGGLQIIVNVRVKFACQQHVHPETEEHKHQRQNADVPECQACPD